MVCGVEHGWCVRLTKWPLFLYPVSDLISQAFLQFLTRYRHITDNKYAIKLTDFMQTTHLYILCKIVTLIKTFLTLQDLFAYIFAGSVIPCKCHFRRFRPTDSCISGVHITVPGQTIKCAAANNTMPVPNMVESSPLHMRKSILNFSVQV
jgi:hypothetical protein